jgi:hypothetical protein
MRREFAVLYGVHTSREATSAFVPQKLSRFWIRGLPQDCIGARLGAGEATRLSRNRTIIIVQLRIEFVPIQMLADIVVGVHLLIVLFILLGVPLVYLGAALHWTWVRSRPWRMLHLGAILFVAAESLLGIMCPLTVWEDTLRGGPVAGGFIERSIDRVIFYDAPTWIFTLAYVGFATLVLVTWVVVPPIRQRRTGRKT